MEQYISTTDFNLLILSCGYFNGYSLTGAEMAEREVYDYEFEYFLNSDGGIIYNGNPIPFEKGSLNFRTPGQRVQGIAPYECIFICFDVLGDKGKDNSQHHFGNADKRQPRYNNEIFNKIPFYIPAKQCINIEKLFFRILKNYSANTEASILMSKSDLYLILYTLYSAFSPTDRKNSQNLYIQKAVPYIKNNYREDIKIHTIAEFLGISTNYFQKIFRESMGVSPKRYINKLRIEEAKYLLDVTNIRIEEIGARCGFLDNVYFSYVFRQHTGLTATEYRKNTFSTRGTRGDG